MLRSAAYDRLARARDELEAARFALSVVVRDWDHRLSRALLPGGRSLVLDNRHRCRTNAELTYIVRLVATYEAVLRDYWLNGARRASEPGLRQLMNSVARRRSMDPQTLETAHGIGTFRNEIVHRDVQNLRFDFPACGSALGKYLSWLPIEW